MSQQPDVSPQAPASQRLTAGRGWTLSRFVCDAGPQDAPFEERHDAVSIAAVVEGTFTYRSDSGRGLLHPGSLLLGNFGACYQCGHDHGRGDCCLSARIEPELFEEVAASHAGLAAFRFPAPMLPADQATAPQFARLAVLPQLRDPLRRDEAFLDWLASILIRVSGESERQQHATARDERRIGRVLRHIERFAHEPLDLDALAAVAAMSKFHFLRVFRRVTGVTPYSYVVSIRMRIAATRLAGTADTITSIAFETGFGDLSGFNASFRAHFGKSPGAYRRQWKQP